MVITGRVPLLLALGLVPVVLRPAMGTVWGWLLLVALVTVIDWLLAVRPATLAHPTAPRSGPSGSATTPRRGSLSPTPGREPSGHWSATRGSRRPGPPATGTASGSPPVTPPCSPPACVLAAAATSARSG